MSDNNKNSYLPLFRKYRPQSFKDVIGQDFTVKALENAIKLNKIANAYLFCGPRGTGKTSSARIFAKSLNCKEGPTVDPCQKCQSCLDVTNASGLDVIEIDAATNRGIDDAKELINKVQYAPMNGKYKIFIIDEVHMLSKEAFNALLKTFEEPPKNVIFILATTEPHKVIETIVSRCQRFDFRRITIDDIVKRLREISDIEKINITDDALFSIAKNVSGGMRDSLALLDQASILGIEKQITKEVIEDLIGKLTFDVLFNLTSEILNNDIEKAVCCVENIYEKGSEPRNFIENYIEFLRNITLVLSSSNLNNIYELTLLSKENIEKIKSDKRFTKEKILFILDKVIEFYKEIKISTNPYLWAELAIISVAKPYIAPCVENISLENKPATGEIKVEQKIQKAPEIEKAQMQNEPAEGESLAVQLLAQENKELYTPVAKNEDNNKVEEIKPQEISQRAGTQENLQETEPPSVTNESDPVKVWTEILNKIDSVPAKFFYQGLGKLVGIKDKHITLGFMNENILGQAKGENKNKPLIKAIHSVLGEGGSVECVLINENTKIIDTKINVKISNPAPQPKTQPRTFAEKENPPESFKTEQNITPGLTEKADFQIEDEASENEAHEDDLSTYTQTTREMLQTFNGRLIEQSGDEY